MKSLRNSGLMRVLKTIGRMPLAFESMLICMIAWLALLKVSMKGSVTMVEFSGSNWVRSLWPRGSAVIACCRYEKNLFFFLLCSDINQRPRKFFLSCVYV